MQMASVSGISTVFLLAWKASQIKDKEQVKNLKNNIDTTDISESLFFCTWKGSSHHHPALQRSNVLS